MRFAVTLPWWGYLLVFAAAVALAWFAYARVPLTRASRALLTGIRALTLLLLVAILLRPVHVVPVAPRDSVVPILVDVSRSMRLDAGDGTPRIDRAGELVRELSETLGAEFRPEVLTFGESLARGEAGRLAASARRSDLSGALSEVADRYRGQRVAGVIVLSDGGDTAGEEAGTARASSAPVFTIGIGGGQPPDREILNLTAGEPLLPNSSVDLSVSAASHGFDEPLELRLTANGRPLEVRRVQPGADGAPVHETFTVAPDAETPTVYTVEIPVADGELAPENNTRSVLVPPRGRVRRVLVVEGAPGFEHTFLKRALARDTGLQVDSAVRKGQNDQGRDTFFVQAGERRAAALAGGYPSKRADLFAYDAIVFGNIEADFFSREQLEMTSEFVSRRGGGLLVLGARSFERAGLLGTAIDEVLPLDFTDRSGAPGLALAMAAKAGAPATNAIALTPDGARHPATRLALSMDESRARWASLPPLAAASDVGAPRAGAEVLAVTRGSDGSLRPLLVTQRYGLGRSMVFAGEASWRWRMLLPATDNTHETAWRQMARWLSAGAPDAVAIAPLAVALPESTETVYVQVRDEEFRPVTDAVVSVRVTGPGGEPRDLTASLADAADGRYAASVRFEQPGVYRLSADASRPRGLVGTATRPVLVGGVDAEMSEPRLNEPVLRRIAASSGGTYVPAARAGDIPGLLRAARPVETITESRDVWHTGWSLAAIIALLAGEWLLRRRVGLA